jgi:hypothetical protein
MSGPISIGSPAEWQTLLTDTNVVIADCIVHPSSRVASLLAVYSSANRGDNVRPI